MNNVITELDPTSKLVNGHEYGSGVAILTRDGDAAREFAKRIQIGMVGLNVSIPVPDGLPQPRRPEATCR